MLKQTMTDHMQPINSTILLKARNILKKRFSTSLKIKSADFLSEPDRRNVVLRLHLESESNGVPNHVILKQSLPEQKDADDKEAYARFARDWAGLEFASSIQQTVHNVPRFYGGNKAYRFILIEDLGQQHISLVDSLTRPNYDNAIAALSRFVKALGSFHASCFGHTALYETMLRKIHPKAETRQEGIKFAIDELLPILELVNKKLGLPLSTECISEAKHVIESMLTPGLFTVLTHGDICPDNVFDHEETCDMQLIDFEWALVGNALLDGTYLRMSMPTCWCVKAIPDEVIEPLELIYREELKRIIPAASDDVAYARAYTEACGFWLLQQTLPFLDSTIDKDRVGSSGPVPENSLWEPKENWVRPRVLSRLQAFINVATKQELLPYLRQMAVGVLIAVKKRWPEAKSLEYYPAFRLNTNKQTAISWATAYLENLGIQLQSEFVQVCNMPWSKVYCISTSVGKIYLKQPEPSLSIEGNLILQLSQSFPERLPHILGQHHDMHCFLMQDAGRPLRNFLQTHYQIDLAKKGLTTYASLQKGCVNQIDSLLALGVPDWRMSNLPGLYMSLLTKDITGLTLSEINRLQKLQPQVTALCDQLMDFNIPETIEQSDFHDNNILVNKNKDMIINDWGETVITHPFFSLISFFISAARIHSIKEPSSTYSVLRDAYLEEWLGYEPKDRLLDALELAKRLGYIKYALSFYRITQCPGWADTGKNKDRIAAALKMFLQSEEIL